MANCVVEIPDIDETITRRIAMDVSRSLMSKMAIPINTPVLLPNSENPEILTQLEHTDSNVNAIFSRCKFKVQVTDVHNEAYNSVPVIQRQDYRPIFEDKELGICASPLYERRIMTIQVGIICNDKVTSEKIRSDIRHSAMNGRLGLLHEAAYHYMIPLPVLGVLIRLHKSSLDFINEVETHHDWLYKHIDEQVTRKTTVAGTQEHLAKNEVQRLILGKFDFLGAPDKPDGDDGGTKHIITFNYELHYERPYAIAIDYPVMIHNNIIDRQLIDRERRYSYTDKLHIPSRFVHFIDEFNPLGSIDPRDQGVCVPHYMQWFPTFHLPYTETLYRLSIRVTNDSRRSLFNIGNLGQVNFKESVINYILSIGRRVFEHRNGLILITLHENDKILSGSNLTIDVDGNVSTTFDMDIRKRYNIHITAYFRLRHMDQQAQYELRRDPDLCNLILAGLDQRLVEQGILPIQPINGVIPKVKFEQCCQFIESYGTIKINDRVALSNFIMGSYVVIAEGN